MPEDSLNPRGNVVSTYCFVDAGLFDDRATRRYHTGVLIFVNKAPILWYSKQYNTVDTRMFTSDSINLKTATELVKSLWYKLCMFGIPIKGPTNVFCDNESVYKNVSTPDLTFNNNSVSILYHKFREAVANGVSLHRLQTDRKSV